MKRLRTYHVKRRLSLTQIKLWVFDVKTPPFSKAACWLTVGSDFGVDTGNTGSPKSLRFGKIHESAARADLNTTAYWYWSA